MAVISAEIPPTHSILAPPLSRARYPFLLPSYPKIMIKKQANNSIFTVESLPRSVSVSVYIFLSHSVSPPSTPHPNPQWTRPYPKDVQFPMGPNPPPPSLPLPPLFFPPTSAWGVKVTHCQFFPIVLKYKKKKWGEGKKNKNQEKKRLRGR